MQTSIQSTARDFYHFQSVSTNSGGHAASYSMGTRVIPPPPVEQTGSDVDHSTPSNAEAKNEWSYTAPPPTHLRIIIRWHLTIFSITTYWAVTRYSFVDKYERFERTWYLHFQGSMKMQSSRSLWNDSHLTNCTASNPRRFETHHPEKLIYLTSSYFARLLLSVKIEFLHCHQNNLFLPLQAEDYLRQMSQQTLLVYCCQFKCSTADPPTNRRISEINEICWFRNFGPQW
jgi:hypothetical protein